MRLLGLIVAYLLLAPMSAQTNQVPVLTNLTIQKLPSGGFALTYDVSDAENDPLEIILQLSADGGYQYGVPLTAATGHIGFPVTPGTGKRIEVTNYSMPSSGKLLLRLTALDRRPLDVAELIKQVDSIKLKQRLAWVEGVRHRSAGATKLRQVQDSIANLFRANRLGFKEHNFTYLSTYTARNLLGNRSGYAQIGHTVIVDAHYDSVSNAPGADDNGSGTVAMMELSSLLAEYPSRKGLRFIGFDLEEVNLTGSANYVNSLPASDTITGVFNFEMIGYYDSSPNTQTLPAGFTTLFPAASAAVQQDSFRGNFITNVANSTSVTVSTAFKTAATTYVPSLKVIDLVVPGNGSIAPDLTRSDHAPFWLKGKPAIMLTDGAEFRNKNYHTASDKSDKLNFTFMQQVTQATLAAVVALAEVEHGSWATIDADILVDAQPLPDIKCKVSPVRAGTYIELYAADCQELAQMVIAEIYTIDGKRLSHQEVDLSQPAMLELPQLPFQIMTVFLKTKDNRLIWSGKL